MAAVQKVVRRLTTRFGEHSPNTLLVSNPIQKPRPPSRRDKPLAFPPGSLLVRKSIQKGVPLPKIDVPVSNYGQYIYLYANIQTNQVVYSLTRHLRNQDAIEQLPYLGKKTVPPALRKDLWSPFALVYFPSHHAGLGAYRKLREFRRLHETSYDLEDITDKEGKYAGSLYPIKKRGRILMNQKANSIADLAAVLLQQEKGLSEERLERQEKRMKRVERLKTQKGAHRVKKDPVDIGREMGGVKGVCVRWVDILDAEFAETWPEAVVHAELKKRRYDAAWPVMGQEEAPMKVGEVPPGVEKAPETIWDRLTSFIPGRAQRAAVATA